MTKRKFYRTIITVEVLSEEPYRYEGLQNLAYDSQESCSVNSEVTKTEEVDGVRMARLLQKQASDPEFFQLDKFGNDIEGD